MACALHLFGASHLDRYSSIQEEIECRVTETDAEAICIEAPEERIQIKYWLLTLLRLPLVITGFAMIGFGQLALFALFARSVFPGEVRAAQEVHTDQGIPLHKVDPHFQRYFSAGGLWFIIVNWVILIGIAIVFSPIQVAVICILANIGFWFLRGIGQVSERIAVIIAVPACIIVYIALFQITSILLVFVVFFTGIATLVIAAKLTGAERTDEMISKTKTSMVENEYKNVLYVTGQGRISTLRDRITNLSDIEIGSVWLKDRFENGELEQPTPDK
ncbi:hypothetical protein [Halarchaeum nitratireducens]|uniref:Uncharacterized protein n=1 Tax=Halarchaeum nitratireducens TaxID=489913 RepID=A0A830G913_9EURY|nr:MULTISPECIES: hypothetical protein [Halarchaeum]MBP2249830.1 transcriptional antiterminator Rof (Rho-off) [Halarchaeum solikamskense]GGN10296.1 hypothetical protein GCM10009021_07620 [Halarchaeum nitratireducens]